MGGRWTVRIVVIGQRYKLNDNAKNDNRYYTDNNDNDSHFIAGLHGATIIYIYMDENCIKNTTKQALTDKWSHPI